MNPFSGLAQQIASAPNTISVEDEELNSFEQITQYNNFYELGTGKDDPALNASALVTDPWSIEIAGECDKPGTYTLEDILRPHALA